MSFFQRENPPTWRILLYCVLAVLLLLGLGKIAFLFQLG